MNAEDELTLWLGAFRYYCGRRSYAVSSFCELLCREWPSLSERTRELIRRDLEEEFGHDDRAQDWRPLGDSCDRESWERVRALWKS